MVDAAISSARELLHEIWDVEQEAEKPEIAQRLGRVADRLSNIGTVLLYAVLVAYLASTFYQSLPNELRASQGVLTNKWWFWTGVVVIVLGALRSGLTVTKALKKWNVASIAGSLLLFNLILKQGPPLFGLPGISPVDHIIGTLDQWQLGELMRGAMGL